MELQKTAHLLKTNEYTTKESPKREYGSSYVYEASLYMAYQRVQLRQRQTRDYDRRDDDRKST